MKLTPGEMGRLWRTIEEEGGWGEVPLIEGALEGIKFLQGKFRIALVSARPASIKEVSLRWLAKHGIPYNSLFITDEQPKLNFIKENKLDIKYFVEDKYEYARELADYGIKVFLMSYPWNISGEVVQNMYRVNNWREVKEKIREMEGEIDL